MSQPNPAYESPVTVLYVLRSQAAVSNRPLLGRQQPRSESNSMRLCLFEAAFGENSEGHSHPH